MKKKTSQKTRIFLLITGWLVFSILCYKLAFRKTLTEFKNYNDNLVQLASIEDAPLELRGLEIRSKELESFLNSTYFLEDNIEILLLGKATSLIRNSNLKIVELPQSQDYTKNGYSTKLQHIILQGSFIELIKVLHYLEKDRSIGSICSVDFFSQKNLKNGEMKLNMKIYFQIIIQEKNEN